MQKSYDDFAKYYDIIYQQKDYEKEVEFIKAITQEKNISHDSILDVGCGTGTHLLLLKNEFKILYGVDISEKILDIAEKKIPEATFSKGKMEQFKLNIKFDVITCLYSVFNYNLSMKSAIKTLKNFYLHLKPFGIVIISLYNERKTEKQFSMHIGKDYETKVAKLNEFKYYPEEKMEKSNHLLLVKDNGDIDFDIEVEDKFRIYDFEEIKEMVEESSFKGYRLYDNFTFEEAKEDETKYPVLVLKKGG